MISSRRRVVNENDRYGGYSSQPTFGAEVDNYNDSRVELDLDYDYSSDRNSRANSYSSNRTSSYSDRISSSRDTSPVSYSPRLDYEEYDNRVNTVSIPAPTYKSRKTPKRRDAEELMPSIKTRSYSRSSNESEEVLEKIEKKPRARVSQKQETSSNTKLMLGIYLAVILILAAVVIGTGVAINSSSASIDSLENQVSIKNDELTKTIFELEKITDDTYIMGAASQNGMEKIDSIAEIELIEEYIPVQYEARTNWFDKFCDWLGSIFGG